MGIPDHLTCMQVKKQQLELDMEQQTGSKLGKEYIKACTLSILSPCLFNLRTAYIMQNKRLNEAPCGIKTSERNINNLRYADDIILLAEAKEELKSLLMKVKEESEKASLKLNFKKRRSWHPIPSLNGRWGNNGNSERVYFLGLQNHCRW